MKRDMNLIRDLLLFYESDCSIADPSPDSETRCQHIIWCIEGGLLAGTVADSSPSGNPRSFRSNDGRTIELNGMQYAYFPLTWEGCDFLSAARDDNRWNKAMRVVGSLTFETIKAYLQSAINDTLT